MIRIPWQKLCWMLCHNLGMFWQKGRNLERRQPFRLRSHMQFCGGWEHQCVRQSQIAIASHYKNHIWLRAVLDHKLDSLICFCSVWPMTTPLWVFYSIVKTDNKFQFHHNTPILSHCLLFIFLLCSKYLHTQNYLVLFGKKLSYIFQSMWKHIRDVPKTMLDIL